MVIRTGLPVVAQKGFAALADFTGTLINYGARITIIARQGVSGVFTPNFKIASIHRAGLSVITIDGRPPAASQHTGVSLCT
jgi:hypothetical protein